MWTGPLSGLPVYQQTWHHMPDGREADTREIWHMSIWGALFWIAHLLWHRSNTSKTTFRHLCKWAPYTHGAYMAFVYHAENIQRTHSVFFFVMFFSPSSPLSQCDTSPHVLYHTAHAGDCDNFKGQRQVCRSWASTSRREWQKKPFNTAIPLLQCTGSTAGDCNFALYQVWSGHCGIWDVWLFMMHVKAQV